MIFCSWLWTLAALESHCECELAALAALKTSLNFRRCTEKPQTPSPNHRAEDTVRPSLRFHGSYSFCHVLVRFEDDRHRDSRGPPDTRGPPPEFDMRGPPPDFDMRGPPPGMWRGGRPPFGGPRGPPPRGWHPRGDAPPRMYQPIQTLRRMSNKFEDWLFLSPGQTDPLSYMPASMVGRRLVVY